jgi:hypothetical protein
MKSELRPAEGTPEGERAPSGPKPHERVPLLLGRAREDAQACRELIDALIAMRAPGDEADEARVVVGALEASSLDGLRDEAGRDAKAEAVETLLSLGFPHALTVSPADLEYFRDEKPHTLGGVMLKIRRSRQLTLAIAFTGQVLTGGAVTALTKEDMSRLPLSIVLALATVGGAAWINSRPPDKGQALAMAGLVLGLLGSAAVAALAGPIGLGLGLVASVGVYNLLGWQPSK